MNSIRWLHGNLKPPKFFSWQTFILIALILWFFLILVLLSVPGIEYDETFLNALAQLFFVVGVGWWQTETPWKLGGFPLGPWIVSALVCTFVFENDADRLPDIAFLMWPLLTAFLSSLPFFFNRGFKFQVPPLADRIKLTLFWLLCLLVCCWLQFHFYITAWLASYPNLLVGDLPNSQFVVRIGDLPPENEPNYLGGRTVLDALQWWTVAQIQNYTWPEVEKVLFDLRHRNTNLEDAIFPRTKNVPVAFLWKPEIDIMGGGDRYNLNLRARWRGPASEAGIPSLVRTCRVQRTPPDPQVSAIGVIECQADIEFEDAYEPT